MVSSNNGHLSKQHQYLPINLTIASSSVLVTLPQIVQCYSMRFFSSSSWISINSAPTWVPEISVSKLYMFFVYLSVKECSVIIRLTVIPELLAPPFFK